MVFYYLAFMLCAQNLFSALVFFFVFVFLSFACFELFLFV